MDSLDTSSLPIPWSPQILSIKPSGTLPEPAFKPRLARFLHGTASLPQEILPLRPAPSELRGSCRLTVLHSTLRNLPFSPSLSCFPSFLRDLPVLVGTVEGILRACACTQLFLPFPWSGCLLLRLSPPASATISNSSLRCHFPSQLLPAPYVLLTLLFPFLETPCKCQTGISRHYVLH